MIQRIQTIYFLLATIASAIICFVPLGASVNMETGNQTNFLVYHNYFLLALGAIPALIALINIFLYKNRPLQIKLGRLNCVLISILIGLLVFYLAFNATTKINLPKPGLVFPLFALIFNILGLRGVVADEKLIESMDRLR
ncbi:MAG: DUF4293 domain-containing protein [Chitinophagales bacterium]|nr:DUF4293 domain-containing protein [Chitinophagales bacterium]